MATPPTGRPEGRPTNYRPEHCDRAYRLCLLGLTIEDLAESFQVSRETVYAWQREYPGFSDAITRGREQADTAVAEKLYHRALGYSHPAVKIFMPAGADEPVYAEYTEHFPPDTQAASLWLRNRQPGKWRDRQELTGAGGKDLVPENADPGRVAAAILELLRMSEKKELK